MVCSTFAVENTCIKSNRAILFLGNFFNYDNLHHTLGGGAIVQETVYILEVMVERLAL